MARSAVELDFFRMEKENSSKPPASKLFNRRRSFRDIQSVVSKINPEVLKNVIASGSVNQSLMGKSSVPSTPRDDQTLFPALPVYTPIFRPSSGSETAPLTIFYNGSVAVFDVPRHKAENILKLAEQGGSKPVQSIDSQLGVSSSDRQHLLETLDVGADLPIARRKSLQSFLAKRKDRLTMVSPYGFPSDNAFSGQNLFRA